MSDFYTLLKQSIIERDIREASDREVVYTQARQAIVKQLWAYEPPLAADEIDSRVGAYDTAVERIEVDLRTAFANGDLPPRAKAERSPPQRQTEASEEDDEAPPFAAWRRNEPADAEEDEREYERGIPRATRANGGRRHTTNDHVYEEEAAYAGDATYSESNGRDEDKRPDRWSDDGSIAPAVRRDWWRGFSERDKIRILAGAIIGLVVALGGLAAYLLLSGGDDGVTLAIGVRREVSDAATAARIPNDKLDVAQSFALFDGRDPTIFATTPDNPVRFDSDSGFVRASSSVSAPGVKAIIGPGLAARLAGQRVRVTIVGRSSAERGAAAMRFAYQSGVAISHWQTANLAPEYEAVGMIWRVPAMRTSQSGDYLLIEPGIPGDGTGVDIQSIKIDLLAGEES